jgi:hypothetical protein
MQPFVSKLPITVVFTIACALALPGAARAEPPWTSNIASLYPTATRLVTCGTCHRNFTAFGSFNPYGTAFRNAAGSVDAKLQAIENMDSDGDGTLNSVEIMTGAGFMPGYTCDTYQTTTNAPADLADYVDPIDIGCVGVVTTSSSTSTSSTASSTTTTLPPTAACSQPVSSGPSPVATDCLFILRVATALETCSPECVCAPKGSLPPSATDSLICLQVATGQSTPLNCPCP